MGATPRMRVVAGLVVPAPSVVQEHSGLLGFKPCHPRKRGSIQPMQMEAGRPQRSGTTAMRHVGRRHAPGWSRRDRCRGVPPLGSSDHAASPFRAGLLSSGGPLAGLPSRAGSRRPLPARRRAGRAGRPVGAPVLGGRGHRMGNSATHGGSPNPHPTPKPHLLFHLSTN